jgi:hypothetical protein
MRAQHPGAPGSRLRSVEFRPVPRRPLLVLAGLTWGGFFGCLAYAAWLAGVGVHGAAVIAVVALVPALGALGAAVVWPDRAAAASRGPAERMLGSSSRHSKGA